MKTISEAIQETVTRLHERDGGLERGHKSGFCRACADNHMAIQEAVVTFLGGQAFAQVQWDVPLIPDEGLQPWI